jgi:transcriptional regulator with GAF, ATPase, and Fis domain
VLVYKKGCMLPHLIAVAGPLSGTRLPLTGPEMSVGRDAANQLTLVDPSVSPRQCVFRLGDGRVTIRECDPGNPSFVNGLPAGDRTLQDGDQIQIGVSVFVLQLAEPGGVGSPGSVQVADGPPLPPTTIVMCREDMFADAQFHRTAPAHRVLRDLAVLIRASAAISAVRGLVALERPVIELIADVVPASRGALVVIDDRSREIKTAVGWSRGGAAGAPVQVSRPLIDRVLRDAVGILAREGPGAGAAGAPSASEATRSVLAAPLVAFDKLIGAIVLEADGVDNPFDEGHLRLLMAIAGIAATAFEYARQIEWLEGTNRSLQAELNLDHNMVGESAPMRDVYRRIARVAPTDSTVLITGESGTGKELVARSIHRNSGRANRPFVAINCAAITETLLESELFGHEKGAFTGAIAMKKGKLEVAGGGTVFLDEIGELSVALQAKLLRVLQEKEFERVGGTKPVRVDFRLIAATNRDLKAAIDSGAFRRDLYYRLNVVSVAIPQLRDRQDDIPLLAAWFLRRHSDKAKRQVAGFSPDALACLMAYEWPGNVRELENAVEQAVVLGQDVVILSDDLPDAVAETASSAAGSGAVASRHFHTAIRQAKKELIAAAVQETGGNYSAAARLLGLHPNYLHRLVRNLRLKDAPRNVV